MTRRDVCAWIDAYGRAWRGRDPDAAARLFSDDATYHSHPFREPHVGRDGIRRYWELATASQEDLDLSFGEPVVEDDRAAVEWWARMRDDAEEITLPGILVLRFAADGRCEELRECWHVEPGRHEPPDGWGR